MIRVASEKDLNDIMDIKAATHSWNGRVCGNPIMGNHYCLFRTGIQTSL